MITPPSPDPPPRARAVRPVIPDSEKVFMSSLDVTVQVVEDSGRLTPAIRAQVVDQFGAYLHKPQVPALVYTQLVDLLCATCLADQPLAEARRLFGRGSLTRYRETILGRVLLATLPIVGLERMLRRAPQDFALACNYGTRSVVELGPHHWRMDFEDEILYPEVLQGIFQEVGTLLHLPQLQTTYTVLGPRHVAFEFRW